MRSLMRKISYEIPLPQLWAERLSSVLVVINLIFNEGYEATSGDALTWGDLCAEAIRLGPWVGWAPTRSKAAIGAGTSGHARLRRNRLAADHRVLPLTLRVVSLAGG